MDYPEYVKMTARVGELIEASRFQEAVEVLYKLILGDISDVDKGALCIRMASVQDRMGKTDEAIAWYDKGIGYEQGCQNYSVFENKAQYLAQIGQYKDSVAMYESLLGLPSVSEAEKQRIRKVIQSVLSRSMREWQ
jgi:tetratricopeptide (TPR) repeat protein